MGTSVSFKNRNYSDMSIEGISGSSGVGHVRLTIKIKVRNMPWKKEEGPGPSLEVLAADVMIDNKFLGQAVQVSPGVTREARDWVDEYTEYLVLSLDSSRLNAIEDIRQGIGFSIQIHLWVRFWSASGPVHTPIVALAREITQSDWAQAVEHMKLRKTVLVEVFDPCMDAPEALGDAIKHFRQAQAHLLNGNWSESIGSCRMVVEALKLFEDPVQKGVIPKKKNKAGRIQEVTAAIFAFTHLAHHHDDVTKVIGLTRLDAQAVITLVAGLLMWFRDASVPVVPAVLVNPSPGSGITSASAPASPTPSAPSATP